MSSRTKGDEGDLLQAADDQSYVGEPMHSRHQHCGREDVLIGAQKFASILQAFFCCSNVDELRRLVERFKIHVQY